MIPGASLPSWKPWSTAVAFTGMFLNEHLPRARVLQHLNK